MTQEAKERAIFHDVQRTTIDKTQKKYVLWKKESFTIKNANTHMMMMEDCWVDGVTMNYLTVHGAIFSLSLTLRFVVGFLLYARESSLFFFISI